jgi:hypothetical protein|tara:strand:- start:1449 stop:1892 length:444 start_codon:yes stop_codon:yes gene_type:complete
MAIQNLRSSTANKRPDPTQMVNGQLAINLENSSPGLFFKDDNGDLVKVGPAHVDPIAPNASPSGTTGNAKGELWLDTGTTPNALRVWNGTAWQSLLNTIGDGIRIGLAKTPSSASDTGTEGTISWDTNYIYVCVATDTWKRVALSTW